jgi:alkylation response protein AidB-like acyl-CoA dehydrogenase
LKKKDYAYTEECMKKAGDLGLLGVAVPEAYGGLGMGFINYVGLRLHFWCNRIFLNCFWSTYGIGTMP